MTYMKQLPSEASGLSYENCELVIAGDLFAESLRKLATDCSLHVVYPHGTEFAIVAPSGQE
jgi:hypothetical protein